MNWREQSLDLSAWLRISIALRKQNLWPHVSCRCTVSEWIEAAGFVLIFSVSHSAGWTLHDRISWHRQRWNQFCLLVFAVWVGCCRCCLPFWCDRWAVPFWCDRWAGLCCYSFRPSSRWRLRGRRAIGAIVLSLLVQLVVVLFPDRCVLCAASRTRILPGILTILSA